MTIHKSTPEDIRQRFDYEVERFSNLETGHSAAMDSPLMLELVAQAAAASNPQATTLLDIGCGAGNYTLKLLKSLPSIGEITLLDLSRPMLVRAVERIAAVSNATLSTLESDIRAANLGTARFDLVLAAMVFHHLRDESEWNFVFRALHRALRPGGSLWIADLIDHDTPAIRSLMLNRYGAYLESLQGPDYRDAVFAYTDREDSPRSLNFQLDLLRDTGFHQIEILHKNATFAAFGASKPNQSVSSTK